VKVKVKVEESNQIDFAIVMIYIKELEGSGAFKAIPTMI
jgi:hypothetical protein